jgi:hypothetical protein
MAVIQPKNVADDAPVVGMHGDRAGEYQRMERGRYSAWLYVGIGFVYVVLLIGVTVGLGVGAAGVFLARFLGAGHDAVAATGFVCDAVVSIAAAYFIYRDRWRVNEAVSSRTCSGVMNLSLIYVPAVSAIYALARGFGKLRGR